MKSNNPIKDQSQRQLITEFAPNKPEPWELVSPNFPDFEKLMNDFNKKINKHD